MLTAILSLFLVIASKNQIARVFLVIASKNQIAFFDIQGASRI